MRGPRVGLTLAILVSALGAPPPSSAAIVTAGPGGSFPNVQDAVFAAILAPGDDEVRIRQGTFVEQVQVRSPWRGSR